MKREELEYHWLDKGGYQGETKAYYKSEADKVFDDYEQRINELEAEVKKWKQDNRYLSAMIQLMYKGKDANSTAIIDVANRMDNLEAENERLRYTLLRIQRGI